MFLGYTNLTGSLALQTESPLQKSTSKAIVSWKNQSQYWHLEDDYWQQEDYFSGTVNLTGWYWAKHELLSFIQTFSNMSWTSKCKLSSMIFILNILPEYISCSSTLLSKIENLMTMQTMLFGASHLCAGFPDLSHVVQRYSAAQTIVFLSLHSLSVSFIGT